MQEKHYVLQAVNLIANADHTEITRPYAFLPGRLYGHYVYSLPWKSRCRLNTSDCVQTSTFLLDYTYQQRVVVISPYRWFHF